MKNRIPAVLFFVTVVILLPACAVRAQETPTADEIAGMSYNRDDGKDSFSRIEMFLIDANGNERRRELFVYAKDYGELSKNFIRFLSPADIDGTGFLSQENPEADDTQHLYLPELGRARRIVSSQKDLRFVNTDFTYEDMQRRKPEKDRHRLLREESWQGHPCYVLEYTPREKKSSQYGKIIQWIDKESFIPVKMEFYNKKGKMFKRLTVASLKKIDGIWTAEDTLMEDYSEKHKTRMLVTEILYNRGADDGIFTLHNLEDY